MLTILLRYEEILKRCANDSPGNIVDTNALVRQFARRSSRRLWQSPFTTPYAASALEEEDSSFFFSVRTYHMQFHTRIAAVAPLGLLQAIEREQVLIFNWLFDTAAHRKSLPSNIHLELGKAISSGEISTADEAMRRHVRHSLDETLAILGTL